MVGLCLTGAVYACARWLSYRPWRRPDGPPSSKQGPIMSDRSAVVQIAGKQMRVHENDVIKVPLLADEVGSSVEFDQVLFVSDDEVKIGAPTVDGAKVVAEVVEHGRDKKIRVFKMKRRKTYRRTKGHRQHFTQLRITAIQA